MDNVPESGTQGGRGFMTERKYLSGRGGKKLLDMEKSINRLTAEEVLMMLQKNGVSAVQHCTGVIGNIRQKLQH